MAGKMHWAQTLTSTWREDLMEIRVSKEFVKAEEVRIQTAPFLERKTVSMWLLAEALRQYLQLLSLGLLL